MLNGRNNNDMTVWYEYAEADSIGQKGLTEPIQFV